MKRNIATISLPQAALPLFNGKKYNMQYHRSDSNQGSDYIAIFITPPPRVRSLQEGNGVMISSVWLFTGGSNVTTTHDTIGQYVTPSTRGSPFSTWTCSNLFTWDHTTPSNTHTHSMFIYIGKQVVGHQLIVTPVTWVSGNSHCEFSFRLR